jgi:type IV pilus assembly protein PilW
MRYSMTHFNRPRCRHRTTGRQRGLTLIELLVAMTLGLVLIGGVLSVVITTRQTLRVNENLAQMQEGARFSFDIMAREIREAGMVPCGTRLTANVLRTAGSPTMAWWASTDAGMLRGFDDAQDSVDIAGFGAAVGDRVNGTDAIMVLRPAGDELSFRQITLHDEGAKSFAFSSPTAFTNAEIVMVCDGRSSALFQIQTASNTPPTIQYGAATLNCSTGLGSVQAQCTGAVAKTFDPDATVARWDPAFWYVGINPQGGRSLYRARIVLNADSEMVTVREEISPGVDNLQIDYLTRNRDMGNALATAWVPASHANFNAGWASTTAEVVAARLTLSLGSTEAVGSDGQRLQRQLIVVASLRNRDL